MVAPTWRDWVFSGKAFAAAMLALYLALMFDLSRPYWAVSAVYIVSNPFAGATKSKALYRVLGTLLGASAAVLFVPVFVNAPELLSLVVALWTGTLLFLSMLDRSARAYVFMLAGYTLPLIALPSVSDPGGVFDVALARSEEITLGILCATLVNQVVFPSSIGRLFSDRINVWLADAGAWAEDILRGEGATPSTPLKRQQLASDVSSLDLMISQLSYDPGTKDVVGQARELRGRLLMLLPVFSSLADRLHAVKQQSGLDDTLIALLNDVADWFKLGGGVETEKAGANLLARIDALQKQDKPGGWDDLVMSSLLTRLKDVVELWQDCLTLRDHIASGGHAAETLPLLHTRRILTGSRHFDHALLAMKVAVVVVGILLACAFWIASGWSQGASFVSMVAVSCSFFAAQDRPAPMIRKMLIWTALSIVVAFVYLFAILPAVTSFEMLVLTLAPMFLFIGLKMSNPQMGMFFMLLAVNSATLIAIQDQYSADLTSFANGGLATLLGIGFAQLWVTVAQPFGAELAARRLMKSGWRDLADTASGSRSGDVDRLSSRSLDRLGQLVPRLAALNVRDLGDVDGFADVRLGFNVVTLQQQRSSLGQESGTLISQVLAGIADHYRRRLKTGGAGPAQPQLHETIDRALETIMRNEGDGGRRVTDALVGLRRVLFGQSPPPSLSPQVGGPQAGPPQLSFAAE
ncbi:FUSC family protein [Agrobacterium vitis]|uniref:FUSC family protein n=1 Tax=Agrobacterium vitis TaxID=373 RepID=UPI0012E8963E|nr:FUSC family protein [Agrobacterium vitis]MCF1465472.1 FUSC family protein [Agrobacterium vitis]MVA77854.1 FUSC family protein [Agrobacterium vitis]